MTREEAIRELRIQFVGEYERQREAKDMAIKALQQQPRWIPVSESMPLIGQEVLVCDFDGDMYITSLHLDGGWGFDEIGNKIKNIVAWQELPLPYKTESEVEE